MIVPPDPSKPKDQHQKSEKKPIDEEVNKNVADVEDLDKTKKVYSWASNYLQSIGHNNLKPIKVCFVSKILPNPIWVQSATPRCTFFQRCYKNNRLIAVVD